jgi:hypothetical protein
MFDLNKIVTDALNAAVAEAIRPLSNRIDELENLLLHRLEKVENNPAIGTDTVLAERVKALEERLDNVTEVSENRIRVIAEAAAEQAIDDHCGTYDHDDYDNVVNNWNDEDPTEFVRESDMESKINDVLNNATVSISV